MKILFVAEQVYLPQLYGGVQTSTDELCAALIERGHQVALSVKLMPGGLFGWWSRVQVAVTKRLFGYGVAHDSRFGYSVWRSWFPEATLNYVLGKFKPELIVVMTGGKVMPLTLAAQKTGIPLLIQLHDIAFEEYGEEFRKFDGVPCVANSQFTATKYAERYNLSSVVINPFISTARYHSNANRDNVTFINPVRQKGCETAIAVARLCPDIPFTFVEGWTLSPTQREDLDTKIKNLPNITFIPSQRNMRAIYERCKILLVPSKFSETFGRVTAEAQTNGIPVIASTRGGLPESVGPGGIMLDSEAPAEEWAAAVRKLWDDPAAYQALSVKAVDHAKRKELDREFQIGVWEQVLQDARVKGAA